VRVLLAGASGAIGRHLVPQLIAAGHEVLGVTRRAGSLAGTGASEVVADLANRREFLDAVAGIRADAVIHHATALARAPARYRDMVATNRLRTEGTSTLLAAAQASGASRFVTASIVYGYGFGDHGDAVLDEDAPFAIQDGAKTDAVQRALECNEQQARAFGGIALRFGLYYGAGANAPIAQHANGVLPWVHVSDAAAATVLALSQGTPGTAYNIVDDTPATWAEVYTAQEKDATRPVSLPIWFLRAAAPFGVHLMAETTLRVSNSRAKKQLEWSPTFASYRDGLAPTLPA
jgi:nucleoside-diphosphate-sugar epimerase